MKAKIEPLEASQMQLKIAEAVTDRLVRHWAMEVDQYQVLRARVIHQTMTLVVFQFQVAQVVHRTNILEVLHLLHLLVAQAAQLAETFEALQIHLVQTGVFHDFLLAGLDAEVFADNVQSRVNLYEWRCICRFRIIQAGTIGTRRRNQRVGILS